MSFGTAIDFSAAFPSPESVKSAGHRAVISYVSDPRPGAEWMKAKPLTREWADRYRQSGLAIVSNFQFGKGDTADWKGGFDAGVRYARRCQDLHLAANGPPNAVLYASIDDNPTLTQYNQQIAPYLRGWESVIGHDRLGVYGNSLVHAWCQEDGIGSFWWLANWGGTRTPDEHTHIHQVRIDKDTVDGIGVDINEILRDDYGQWSRTIAPPPPPIGAPPVSYPIKQYRDGIGCYRGHSQRVRVYLHTSEGRDWQTTAENTADYQRRQQDGSYHYLIDDDHIIQTVDENDTAWAVLNDNPVSINICLVLSSGASGDGQTAQENRPKSRAQWLEHSKMLAMLAWLLPGVCQRWGIPLRRIDAAGVGRNERGVSSHNNYTYGSVALRGFKDGTHWDIPDTFPYDAVLTPSQFQPSGDDDMTPEQDQMLREVHRELTLRLNDRSDGQVPLNDTLFGHVINAATFARRNQDNQAGARSGLLQRIADKLGA